MLSKTTRISCQLTTLALAVCTLLSASAAQANTTYNFSYPTNVPTGNDFNPVTGTYTVAPESFFAISNNGKLTGQWANTNNTYGGFVDNNSIVYSSTAGATNTVITGVNNSGQITGTYDNSGSSVGFYAAPAAYANANPTVTLVDSNTHGSTVASTVGAGINDAGIVVGTSTLKNGSEYLFEYNTATKLYTDIAFGISGVSQFQAASINNNGWVVGNYTDANSFVHGFIYDGSTWSTLDNPNITATATTATTATGINDNGLLAGWYQDANSVSHGFVYDVIKHSYLNDSINDPNGTSTVVTGINNNGTLVGTVDGSYGFIANAATPAAVPLPGAFWLMSTVLAGFGLSRRRIA